MSDIMDKLLATSHEEIKQKTGHGKVKKQPKKTLTEYEKKIKRLEGRYKSPMPFPIDEDDDKESFLDKIKSEFGLTFLLGLSVVFVIGALLNNFKAM